MKFTRRTALTGLAAAGAMAALGAPRLQAAKTAEVGEVGDNGLHTQDWFLESFLDLGEDQAALAKQNKYLAVIFEQRGCSYCADLHRINFGRDDIVSYMKDHFGVIQIDLRGSRTVTDFDGKEMEERALARRWRAVFTPTTVFFPKEAEQVKGRKGNDAEIFRMPGYFKPFQFMSALEFVNEGRHRTGSFQRYLQDKVADLRKKGGEPDAW